MKQALNAISKELALEFHLDEGAVRRSMRKALVRSAARDQDEAELQAYARQFCASDEDAQLFVLSVKKGDCFDA
ncbi:hypothetical protein [Anaeromyxobacter paludicola]|uniref:Uncharacterized protein n=1 Tax=Anaeromyxobacter paludicola TaxID=2918171 RepID=A0ABM7XDV6_9BACT|nr:hypothetical protein [Anaeromyxobacter paludicola]BDG09988.1 hypothetical protein AMPC_31010 [Anaeromyxobacter paludicola]